MNDSHQKDGKDRRLAPRYQITLNAPVIITAAGKSELNQDQYLILQGHLLDVSRSGLGLIISNTDGQELLRFGNAWTMQMLLPLPSQAIELEAEPVRFQQLGKDETGKILVGAHITNMNGRDRILFMDFIYDATHDETK